MLALAGSLSTSAFIFPVLNESERGWEGEDAGQAATSVLLLQDLFVAPPLMVMPMPYVVGRVPTDLAAIGFLTAKATIGFSAAVSRRCASAPSSSSACSGLWPGRGPRRPSRR